MTEILEEFLVKLGFSVDDHAWRKFNDAVGRASKSILDLGASTLSTAIAIGKSVAAMAEHYQDLYYMSQRTGESVNTLLGFSFAASQIGISTETARHSVESFTQALRLNPGMEGLLKAYGVTAADPVTRMQTLVERLKASFGETGYFAAARVGQMFGMDETTFRQMWSNLSKLKQEQSEYNEMLRKLGISSDEAAAKSNEFAQSLNRLENWVSAIGTRIKISLLEPVKDVVDWLSKLLEKTSSISSSYEEFASAVHVLVYGTTSQGVVPPPASADPQERKRALGVGAYRNAAPSAVGPVPGDSAGVIDYFMKQGWTREQAIGIAANLYSESKFNPAAQNPKSGMYGLAQWDTNRRGDFAAWAGHSIYGSSREEQLAFIQYELTAGKEKAAGRALKATHTAGDAGYAVGHWYERPDLVGNAEANRRGQLAEYWGNKGAGNVTVNQTNNVTVSGVSNPQTAATAIGSAIDAKNQQLRQAIRGDTVR